jgi:hypothetical protein
MFAIIAAILFGLALLIELFKVHTNEVFNATTLTTAGLLFIALHLGVGWSPRRYFGRGNRRN